MFPAGRRETGEVGMGPRFDYERMGHAGPFSTVRSPGHGRPMMVRPRRPDPKERKGSKWTPVATRPYKEAGTASVPL